MSTTEFATGNALARKLWKAKNEQLFRDAAKESYFLPRFGSEGKNSIVYEQKDLMSQKPKGLGQEFLDLEIKLLIGLISLAAGAFGLGVFWWYLKTTGNLMMARSVTFALLGVDSLLYVFSCKSLKEPLWKEKIFNNPWLVVAVIVGMGFQIASLYVPGLQIILKTVPLALNDWLVIGAASLMLILLIEGVKWRFNHLVKKVNSFQKQEAIGKSLQV